MGDALVHPHRGNVGHQTVVNSALRHVQSLHATCLRYHLGNGAGVATRTEVVSVEIEDNVLDVWIDTQSLQQTSGDTRERGERGGWAIKREVWQGSKRRGRRSRKIKKREKREGGKKREEAGVDKDVVISGSPLTLPLLPSACSRRS